MTENADAGKSKRNIWVRGFFMLLMAFAFQVAGTVMFVVTVIQFILMLLNNAPNERLVSFGSNLARYLQQIANFLTVAAEDIPFPFSDWPSQD